MVYLGYPARESITFLSLIISLSPFFIFWSILKIKPPHNQSCYRGSFGPDVKPVHNQSHVYFKVVSCKCYLPTITFHTKMSGCSWCTAPSCQNSAFWLFSSDRRRDVSKQHFLSSVNLKRHSYRWFCYKSCCLEVSLVLCCHFQRCKMWMQNCQRSDLLGQATV